ncbi:MAG: ArsR family transcriptional regulator [Anaerolineae bacterium]|nr:ArsR family transcriptional regulator [Anaerolineae bacterium]
MTSTRELVLENLLLRQRCTINDLAEAVNINPISVRHHITKLEASGLVSSLEERHGVGRPRRVYFLTEAGVEQFPTRYLNLTNRLLSKIKLSLSSDTLNGIFSQIAVDTAKNYFSTDQLQGVPFEKRLEIVKQMLTNEGFTITIEKQNGNFLINETSCPYFSIAEEHPEVCIMDHSLISTALGVPAKQTKCLRDGDSYCTYEVTPISPDSIQVNGVQA